MKRIYSITLVLIFLSLPLFAEENNDTAPLKAMQRNSMGFDVGINQDVLGEWNLLFGRKFANNKLEWNAGASYKKYFFEVKNNGDMETNSYGIVGGIHFYPLAGGFYIGASLGYGYSMFTDKAKDTFKHNSEKYELLTDWFLDSKLYGVIGYAFSIGQKNQFFIQLDGGFIYGAVGVDNTDESKPELERIYKFSYAARAGLRALF